MVLKLVLKTIVMVVVLASCSTTSLQSSPAALGQSVSWQDMLVRLEEPGPVVFEKHLSAHWAVQLSGLVNLDHEKARAAGLSDRVEPIEIYAYTIQHPEHGHYLVDSGMSESFRDAANNSDVSWLIRQAMNTSALKVERTTAEIENKYGDVKGVFLTHTHLDHIMGVSDLTPGTPVFIGPGDGSKKSPMNIVTQGTTDRLLAVAGELKEWQFETDVIDIFSDGSVFAIHSPGHTPGSTAYLVRTTEGPKLLLGDACHTAWGWEHGVEPGTFSEDQPKSVDSLLRLKALVQEHPMIAAHPGHQSL